MIYLDGYLKKQALNPQWSKADRVHDWRNYISDHVRAMWDTFTDEQKFALVEMANERAGWEIWE